MPITFGDSKKRSRDELNDAFFWKASVIQMASSSEKHLDISHRFETFMIASFFPAFSKRPSKAGLPEGAHLNHKLQNPSQQTIFSFTTKESFRPREVKEKKLNPLNFQEAYTIAIRVARPVEQPVGQAPRNRERSRCYHRWKWNLFDRNYRLTS